MRKILWLASWYPNETEPFSGDFIKRQAEAVAIHQPVVLIYAGKYFPKSFPAVANKSTATGSLKEYILYYTSTGNSRGRVSRIRSLYTYIKKHLEIIHILREKNELPDLVHVQVAMKAGLIALYLKWKYHIPFVLTEHWSGYYEQSDGSLFKKSFLEKYFTRRILKNAALLLTVSEALGNQIRHYWAQIPFQKIPNVVDTRLFYPSTDRPASFRFIHVSNLIHPKNPEGIIRAFAKLLRKGIQVELVMVGPISTSLKRLINEQDPSGKKILYTDEISYEQVGIEFRKSSALVMFSLYENMPCVILEALCTGIPVIATRVGGIPEVVGDENGLLVTEGDEVELTEAMNKMMLNYNYYDRSEISRMASDRFSYDTVGKEIVRIYDTVLNKDYER